MRKFKYAVIGLYNYGKFYKDTKHNVGYKFSKFFIEKYKNELKLIKNFNYKIFKMNISKFVLYIILTKNFINLSWISLLNFKKIYNIHTKNIIIIRDDVYLPLGLAKIKFGCGHGGHNGVKNIINKLKSKNFFQIKIGIGKNGKKILNIKDFVMTKFNLEENKILNKVIINSINCLEIFFKKNFNFASCYLNSKKIS
ncbi:MAG: aminoacyl-tRNA hydrolase [Enterobacteriaceae bacterium]